MTGDRAQDEDRGGHGSLEVVADDREVTDISAIEKCWQCGWEPAAIVLVEDDWECYNCGGNA